MIQQRITALKQRIDAVCARAGRSSAEVTLVAVTKFAPPGAVEQAMLAGLTHFGENKVQEAEKKYAPLRARGAGITCHMIGHLQTNKVKAALEVFDLIQSVDSLRLLETVARQAQQQGRPAEILVQVNTSGEPQKFGLPPADLLPFLDRAAALDTVRVRGLMTIAPLTEDRDVVRRCFADARFLRDKAAARFQMPGRMDFSVLSMGMTHDFEIALEEGATMLRVGTAIFAQ